MGSPSTLLASTQLPLAMPSPCEAIRVGSNGRLAKTHELRIREDQIEPKAGRVVPTSLLATAYIPIFKLHMPH